MPVTPDDLAVETSAGAVRHWQHLTGLGDRLELQLLAESNVAVRNGLRGVVAVTANAERRNPEADFDDLSHVLSHRSSNGRGTESLVLLGSGVMDRALHHPGVTSEPPSTDKC